MKSETISADPDPTPEVAPATPAAPPATEPETPETPPATEEEPEPETAPAPAEASAAPAKLTAFQRGALRALSLGELVSRVEAAEMNAAILQSGNVTLAAENQRLLAENTKLKADIPLKVAEAAQVREGQVTKAVAAELQSLGVSADAAPSQLTADASEKIKSRAEFDAMPPKERSEFFKTGGKLTD